MAKNEAGWNHTRVQRRQKLRALREQIFEIVEKAGAEDAIEAIAFGALVRGPDGYRAHQSVIVYGANGLARIVAILEEALLQTGQSMQAAEEARRESRVKGRREHAH